MRLLVNADFVEVQEYEGVGDEGVDGTGKKTSLRFKLAMGSGERDHEGGE